MSVPQKRYSLSQDPRALFYSRLESCRQASLGLIESLEVEDLTVQPIADVSPIKWHLAHPTWFFEELILSPHLKSYKKFDESYNLLFNSYYKALGPHWAQGDRGSLSRPTVKDILRYRGHVDAGLRRLFDAESLNDSLFQLLELGIQHEQQHQELIVMDIKYILSRNPSLPKYSEQTLPKCAKPSGTFQSYAEGIYEIGFEGEGFCFDNEKSRHKVYLYPFAIAESLVTNRDFQEFIDDNGYGRSEHWLSMGWDCVRGEEISAPLYWAENGTEYTLHGSIPRNPNSPVSHLSFFEASAYAKWKGMRLPREAELEVFLNNRPLPTKQAEFHATDANATHQQLWNWTQSAYSPYPGFKEFEGPTREYNGKFMCNQFVLRGGCVATPEGHYRRTYRNFFLPHQRWMFSGLRLAKDI